MKIDDNKRQTGCPIAFGLDIFGDRWSLLVIRDMMVHGKSTYGEFLDAGEGISTNILADRLKRLESDGIVEKSRDPDNRRSFIYKLTPKGRDLAPVIMQIILWSGAHDHRSFALHVPLERLQNDPERFEEDLRRS
jgi:DNA-binding HxlR family transcriptional regulator